MSLSTKILLECQQISSSNKDCRDSKVPTTLRVNGINKFLTNKGQTKSVLNLLSTYISV